MPRQPLSDRELAICHRLKVWRESEGKTRASVAKEVGLSADSYGNYEYARAPLRYDLACRLFSRHKINPAWLATGEGFHDIQISVPAPSVLKVSPRDLFSQVYDRCLRQIMPSLVEQALAKPVGDYYYFRLPYNLSITPDLRVKMEAGLFSALEKLLDGVPDARFVQYLNDLLSLAGDLCKHHPSDSAEIESARSLQLRHSRRKAKR